MADLDRFRTRLTVKHDKGSTFEALCPAHDDRNASLTVSLGDYGGVVISCHAGCATTAVVAALGLTMGDLAGEPHIVASYPYQDEAGALLWWQHRWSPKRFTADPGQPVPAQRVLYNLPWVVWAVANDQLVYIVEGEKDVETLREHNIVGTCNPNGAGPGKWLDHYSDWLRGADVVILADNDEPGIAHARAIYSSVVAVARTVSLERTRYGKDVTDLLTAGYGIGHTEVLPLADTDMGGVYVNTLRPRSVTWAWSGYIPFGGITLVDGDPGEGKSTLVCDLVARWSSGLPMPDDSAGHDRQGVVMITAEDDPAATILPRLQAAGADTSKVLLLTDERDDDDIFLLSGRKLAMLEAFLVEHQDFGIVTLDPLSAFWPAGVNSYVDAEVRAALRPLAGLARRCNVAILLVRHLTKSASKALYAGSGSIGIIGASRAAYLVKPDPTDPSRRVLAPLKNNLSVRPSAQAFRLVEASRGDVARISWEGAVAYDTEEVFTGDTENISAQGQGRDWLEQVLDNTFMTWRELCSKGKAVGGWSESTLRRARNEGGFRAVVNPAIGGLLSTGTYWIRADQWPFDTLSDESDRLLTSSGTGNLEQTSEPATPSEIAPPDQVELVELDEDGGPVDFESRPRICDVCGTEHSDETPVAYYASPWWVVRCRPHNPRTYSP